MAADGTTTIGSRGAKYRAVARATILGRPASSPKPTPATVADRAISVASGNLQSMWEDLLEAAGLGLERSRTSHVVEGGEVW